jgi:hypothetical protein
MRYHQEDASIRTVRERNRWQGWIMASVFFMQIAISINLGGGE